MPSKKLRLAIREERPPGDVPHHLFTWEPANPDGTHAVWQMFGAACGGATCFLLTPAGLERHIENCKRVGKSKGFDVDVVREGS